MSARPIRVLAVTGLRRERRVLDKGGGAVLAGGGEGPRLARSLDQAAHQGVAGFISIGIAGGLRPGLACGTVIIGTGVVFSGAHLATDAAWTANLARLLAPGALTADIAAGDAPVSGIDAKAALHQRTEAAAVDMESHMVARAANRHGLPFAVLRVIADTAERALPPAAVAGFGTGGRINLWAVLAALLASPGQVPGLIGVARDARVGLRALLGCGEVLGPGFGFPDFGELGADVG